MNGKNYFVSKGGKK